MKVVVMEIRGKRSAVLSNDGIVRILPDSGYQVGQVLEITKTELERMEALQAKADKESTPKIIRFGSYVRKHAAVAAAVVIVSVMGTGTGVAAAYYPVSTVSLSTDSSITYRLNIFDKVISVKADDDEGRETASVIEKRVRGKKFDKALSETLDFMAEKGSISEENGSIEMEVRTWHSRESRLENTLAETVDGWNNDHRELPSGVNLIWKGEAKGRPEAGKPDGMQETTPQSGAAAGAQETAADGKNENMSGVKAGMTGKGKENAPDSQTPGSVVEKENVPGAAAGMAGEVKENAPDSQTPGTVVEKENVPGGDAGMMGEVKENAPDSQTPGTIVEKENAPGRGPDAASLIGGMQQGGSDAASLIGGMQQGGSDAASLGGRMQSGMQGNSGDFGNMPGEAGPGR